MNTTNHDRREPRAIVRSLRRNFVWTFFGNAVYSASQWLMLVAIAKLGNPEMVGQYTLALAIASPIMIFASMQLRVVQATDARSEFQFGNYLAVRLVSSSLAMVAILVAGGVYRNSGLALLIAVIALSKWLESLSDVIHGALQRIERMSIIAISMSLKGAVSLVVLAVTLYTTRSLFWAVVGVALAWALVLLAFDIPAGRTVGVGKEGAHSISPIWSRSDNLRLVSLCLPLGVVGVLDSLTTNIPRYFLQPFGGEVMVGYFSAMTYLVVAGHTVIAALANAVRPRLALYHVENRQAFLGLLQKLLVASVVMGLSGIAVAAGAGRWILTIVYSPEYGAHTGVFVWVMLGGAFWYTAGFLNTALTAARRFHTQVPLYFLSSGATLLGCVAMIPEHGLLGAAWAFSIGMAARLLSSALMLWQYLRKSPVTEPRNDE